MISLIIPTMWVQGVIVECLKSMTGQYDELVIVDDPIENLAKKINKGFEKASGDYFVVCNDDIVLTKGNLRDLCKPGKVLSPTIINGGSGKAFHAHMWGMPVEAYEQAVGVHDHYDDFEKCGYYEGFHRFYWDDSDYWMKLITAGYIPEITRDVEIRHDHPATTIGTFGPNEGIEKDNRQIFIDRWGIDAVSIVS